MVAAIGDLIFSFIFSATKCSSNWFFLSIVYFLVVISCSVLLIVIFSQNGETEKIVYRMFRSVL